MVPVATDSCNCKQPLSLGHLQVKHDSSRCKTILEAFFGIRLMKCLALLLYAI